MLKYDSSVSSIEDVCIFNNQDSVKYIGTGLTIINKGKNNKIFIDENVVFNSMRILLESNDNVIKIGSNTRLSGSVIMKLTDKNSLVIGDHTTIGGASFICGEGTKIEIGEDCMIAWDIEFRSTDSHAIFDLTTNHRINIAADIKIGKHVWIGAHTHILKGVDIADGSVISLGSVVVKSFSESNIVIAGIPAKKVREGVFWKRPLLG